MRGKYARFLGTSENVLLVIFVVSISASGDLFRNVLNYSLTHSLIVGSRKHADCPCTIISASPGCSRTFILWFRVFVLFVFSARRCEWRYWRWLV